MQQTNKQLLSLRELANILQVTERTLYRWTDEKRIPFYRAGDGYGSYRFDLDEVKDALRTNK